MEKLYTVAEARDYLKISDATIRRYIKDGRLVSHRIGRQHRITESSIKAFIEAQGKRREEAENTERGNNND